MTEWIAVLKISIPVIILDETLKFVARKFTDGNTPYLELAAIMAVWAIYIPLTSAVIWTFYIKYTQNGLVAERWIVYYLGPEL